MLDSDTNARQFSIVTFLTFGQLPATRLFFGW